MGLIDELPSNIAKPEAQAMMIEAIRDGDFEVDWSPFRVEDEEGNVLDLFVTSDAIKVDGVRLNVSARTLQAMADEIGALLLTPWLSDQFWLTVDHPISPQTIPTGPNASKSQMIEASNRVDAALAAAGATPGELVGNVGKDWVLIPDKLSPTKAANFGWYVPRQGWGGIPGIGRTPTGLWAIQAPPGTKHDPDHADYSQVARLVRRDVTLNGQRADLAMVYSEPQWAHMVGSSVPVPVRQPGTGSSPPPPPAPPQDDPPTPVSPPPSEPDAAAEGEQTTDVRRRPTTRLGLGIGLLVVGGIVAAVAASR